MKIGIAFDLVPQDHDRAAAHRDDWFEEFDRPETIEALAGVLRDAGHTVTLLGNGRAMVERVLADPPDLVWNLAEGEGVGRCREARVPAALELLGIPCTGSDPLTIALCLDKPLTKLVVLGTTRVEVPAGWTVAADAAREQIAAGFERHFREHEDPARRTLILKPAFEGSSKGIRGNALADSAGEATALCLDLARGYQQPVLVEEFIAGDEVTVGVVGAGESARVLGLMRIAPVPPDERFVYGLERKRVWDDAIAFEAPARLADGVAQRVARAALAAYRALGCRDVARIDFRVRDGVPYFIEANPLPGLAPDWSDLVLLARGAGLTYADLIQRILIEAQARLAGVRGGPV